MSVLNLRGCAALSLSIAGLFAVFPSHADEAERHARIIERLAPQDRQAYVERLVAAQRARAGASLSADVTGPVLVAFNSATKLNLGNASAPFKVYAKATDDLSGAQAMYFYAIGPSGQQIYVYGSSNFPAPAMSLNLGFTNTNRMLQPGVWKLKFGYGYDGAGNYTSYDEATLDALGNTSFTVTNNSGYDLTPPQLVDGKIITPTVSLSSFLPGTTDKPPSVGIKINVSDAGNSALAGVKSVTLYFCKVANPDKCIYPSAYTYATGQPTAALTAGVRVSAADGVATGTYELRTVSVEDHAGNYSNLEGTKFPGGTTDFSTMFPGGTAIKIKP